MAREPVHAKEHALRFSRTLLLGGITLTAALTATSSAVASTTGADPHHRPHHGSTAPRDSLRALADEVGLRVGVAVNTDLLGENKAYTRIVNQQFNTVTPENVMKWEVVEPNRGTYNWAPADELVASARRNGQLVRGHTLVWHSQLPKWLATTEPDGSQSTPLSKSQLRAVLKQHIRDEVTHFQGKIW